MKDLFGNLTKNETIQKRDYEEYTVVSINYRLTDGENEDLGQRN